MVAVASSSPFHGCGSAPNFISTSSLSAPIDHRPLALDAGERLGELGIDEQEPGAGVLDDVLDLLGDEAEVDRHEDAPGPRHAEQRGEQAGRVVRHHRDPFALGDAERVEAGRERPRPLGHVAVRDRAPRLGGLVGLVDDGRAVGVEQLGPAEEVVDRQRNLHGVNAIRSPSTPGRWRARTCARAVSGHGRSRSTLRATSSSSGSVKWRPMTCRPIGSPSTKPAGIEIAGLPCRLAGNVSRPLLPAPRFDAAERRRERAVGGERDVGVAGRDHQVDAAVGDVEDARHRLVELGAAAFDPRPCIGRVQPFGAFETGADLGRQVVGARRPALTELGPDRDHPADRPGGAHPWQLRVESVDAHEATVGDQLPGGLLEQLPHDRRDGRATPVGDDGDPHARAARRRCVPSPSSQPSVRARLSGSRASCPLHTSNQRAVSLTDRERHPTTTVRLPYAAIGDSGMRPNVLFRPTSPQKPAGIRIDPPPSPPVASVTMPPATAAAEPPDEPPGVCPCCHGLWVVPCRTVRVTLTPPNSDAVVWPTSTAPPRSRMRSTLRFVYLATRSLNGTDASVYGHPATASSSFTPTGTPPNGRFTSARAAARSAVLAVEVAERVQVARADRVVRRRQLLDRRTLTSAECLHE